MEKAINLPDEEKINGCIVTFFMSNLKTETVKLQREVVEKYNVGKYPHYSIHTELRHGASMDLFWRMNGLDHPTFKGHEVPQKFNHDVVMFLDVDALPLHHNAINLLMWEAAHGALTGNIQRSNHIMNDQHVFVAPSVLAISRETYSKIGMPTALETPRADVAEEYTFYAEQNRNVPVKMLMPLRFDAPPAECPHWALKDGMPVYGRGTTFGLRPGDIGPSDEHDVREDIELFWHNFQSFHPGQQERFEEKANTLLKAANG